MTSYLDIVVSEVFGCIVSVFPEDVVGHDDRGEDRKALSSVEGTVVVVGVNTGQLYLVTRLKHYINSVAIFFCSKSFYSGPPLLTTDCCSC